jgi:ABC-type transport system involved in multi-copper enzyme maturation permease subunit
VISLVRSELLKIRTTRSWWAYLIAIALLSALGAAGTIGSAVSSERGTADFQVDLVETMAVAVLIAIILGITIITAEFRHGTVTPTFLAAPHREQVIGAKAIAAIIVAIGFALLSLLVIVAVALPWFAIIGVDTHLTDGDFVTRAAQQSLAAVLSALMGIAIGAIVQSQVAALVGTLVWLFLGEALLLGIFGLLDLDGLRPYLPFQALDGADGTGGGDLLSYWPAVGVSLAWIAVIGLAGTERTRRRDIT